MQDDRDVLRAGAGTAPRGGCGAPRGPRARRSRRRPAPESCRAVNESEVVSTQDTARTLLRAALALVVQLGVHAVRAQQLLGVIEVPRLQHHAGEPCDSVSPLGPRRSRRSWRRGARAARSGGRRGSCPRRARRGHSAPPARSPRSAPRRTARSSSSAISGVIASTPSSPRSAASSASWPSSSSGVSSPSQQGPKTAASTARPAALQQRGRGQHHRVTERAREAGLGPVAEHVAADVDEHEQVDAERCGRLLEPVRDARRADADVHQHRVLAEQLAPCATRRTPRRRSCASAGPRASRPVRWRGRRGSRRPSAGRAGGRSAGAPSSRRPGSRSTPSRRHRCAVRKRSDDVAAAADAEHQRAFRPADSFLERPVGRGQATVAAPARTPASRTRASMPAAARSNSSSAITGVPSNGRSRSISTHDMQPSYSGRTRTVTGRWMR